MRFTDFLKATVLISAGAASALAAATAVGILVLMLRKVRTARVSR